MRGSAPDSAPGTAAPPPEVRGAVRSLLASSADFHALDPDTRKTIAGSMVRIAATAKALASEAEPATVTASALNAGSDFSGVAAGKVAGTTKAILDAVSFPRFVTELINGVFKAMNDSNQQQLASYIELIQNVSNTLDGFADTNVGVSGARQWLADRFPGAFVVQGDEDLRPEPGMSAEERKELQAERDASTRLRLVPNGTMPNEAALRGAFGLPPGESVPTGGDPEALVPFARTVIARNRQQMLSTMVMMGMQRIVIESGRLSASMRFHIDTRSAAASDAGSAFDTRTNMDVSGGAKFGPWGMEAKVQSTIGYVSTQRSQTTETMNTDLDLASNVELLFKTDYVQLDRLAGGPTQERIRVNAMNPEAEARLAQQDRAARAAAAGAAETARASDLTGNLARPGGLSPSVTSVPGTAPAKPAAGAGTAAGAGSGGSGTASGANTGSGGNANAGSGGSAATNRAGSGTASSSGSGGTAGATTNTANTGGGSQPAAGNAANASNASGTAERRAA